MKKVLYNNIGLTVKWSLYCMVRWSSFIPAKIKKSKVEEQYNLCDKDKDGKISESEFKKAVPGPVKFFVGNDKLNKTISLFDKNDDKSMSKEEIDGFLKEKFGITYEKAAKMKTGDLVDYIQDTVEKDDKKKK